RAGLVHEIDDAELGQTPGRQLGDLFEGIDRIERRAEYPRDLGQETLRLLLPLPLRHIPAGVDEPLNQRIVQEVRAGPLQHTPAPILVTDTELLLDQAARPTLQPPDRSLDAESVVRMDQVECALADQFTRRVPRHTLDGRTLIADHTARIQDRDDVRRVLDQRAETPLDRSSRLGPRLLDIIAIRWFGHSILQRGRLRRRPVRPRTALLD